MSSPRNGGGNPNLISVEEAISITQRYRNSKVNILKPGVSSSVLPVCETFNRDAFDQLLMQSGCVAVRIYHAMDAQSNVKVLVVGVDSNGNDMVDNSPTAPLNIIIENGDRCPSDCPPNSVLN